KGWCEMREFIYSHCRQRSRSSVKAPSLVWAATSPSGPQVPPRTAFADNRYGCTGARVHVRMTRPGIMRERRVDEFSCPPMLRVSVPVTWTVPFTAVFRFGNRLPTQPYAATFCAIKFATKVPNRVDFACWVETLNQRVEGSSPPTPTNKIKGLSLELFLFRQ